MTRLSRDIGNARIGRQIALVMPTRGLRTCLDMAILIPRSLGIKSCNSLTEPGRCGSCGRIFRGPRADGIIAMHSR